jgi:DNA-binding transcriptional LysR family regulator
VSNDLIRWIASTGLIKEKTMEFRQLRTFIVVANLLNFTRASEKLNMAQSSVSAQIKSLEEDLKLKLFDRIGRRVLLTDAGKKLYKYARRMEEMTLEIQSQFAKDQDIQGSLTVRVPETVASVYMPPIIESFHNDHPKVNLELVNCSDTQLREELSTGRIDAAFLITDDIHFKNVNIKRLKKENLILVSAPNNPLAGYDSLSWKDLNGQTLFLPKTD